MFGGELTAEGNGFGRGFEVEAGDELHAAQHAQRILAKRRRHMAQAARVQVSHAVIGVEQLAAERIKADRIDGEVAACGGVLWRHARIALDHEVGMLGTGFRFTARQRDVDLVAFDDKDAEGTADGIEPEMLF